jgi:hypothetical protein
MRSLPRPPAARQPELNDNSLLRVRLIIDTPSREFLLLCDVRIRAQLETVSELIRSDVS